MCTDLRPAGAISVSNTSSYSAVVKTLNTPMFAKTVLRKTSLAFFFVLKSVGLYGALLVKK